MIHMKCQALFSLKNNKKYFKVLSAVVVISTLRVKDICDDHVSIIRIVSSGTLIVLSDFLQPHLKREDL